MPKLLAVLEKLDELPEALREYYNENEQDGKFYLDLDSSIEQHPTLASLRRALDGHKSARQKAAEEIKTLKDRLAKVPDDFDPDEVARLRATLEEIEANPNRSKDDKTAQEAVAARKMLEQKITNMEKAHATEIEKLNIKLKSKDTFIGQLLIDDGLTKALIDVGVDKGLMKAAKAMLKENVKVVEEDGRYEAVVESDTGTLDIPRFVADWASSDEGKSFVPPPKGSGAGNEGIRNQNRQMNYDKNPWSKENWNMTEQGRLMKSNRALADKMARAAGKQLPAAT